jgi:hypothetical protein
MNYKGLLTVTALLMFSDLAFGNVYGAVRGVVHDPHHRPIQDAMVMIKAKSSDWSKSATTDSAGECPLPDSSVPTPTSSYARKFLWI